MKREDALAQRIAALPPEKRRLLELRLKKAGLSQGDGIEISPAPPAESYPLTFGQQRLWFIEQLMPGTAAYNIPFAGRLVGRLDAERLHWALNEVVRRHAVLRSRFPKVDGQAVQEPVAPEEIPPLPLPIEDLSHLEPETAEAELERRSREEGRAPFDLERPPLVRLKLLQMPPPPDAQEGETNHFLMVTMPHLVTDA